MSECDPEEHRQALVEHLRELKHRVLVSIGAVLLAFGVCYFFTDPIFAFLTQPLAEAMGQGAGRRLMFTGLPEAFVVKMKLAFYTGLLVSVPIISTQVYLFLAPGLYKKEKRVLAPYLLAAPVLFVAGAALAYFYVFPLAWRFFLSFEQGTAGGMGLPVELEARISEYLALVTQIIFAFGVAFQLPILLTLLVRFGLMTTATLRRGRRYAVVILLIVAAILTPPDVTSQIGLFLPLYLLYELSILMGSLIEKKKKEPTDA